jgi:large subunit ribosomal protein L10
MKLDKKKEIVEELHEKFSKSKIVILTDYKGLDVASVSDLRKKLNDVDVEFRVVKNTLLVRASENTDVEVIKEDFKGPSAIALSYDDPVAPAKVMTEFAEGNDKFEIKIGVMGGNRIDVKAIKALSSLPSREVLLGQVLSAMNGVPTSFVRVLNAVPQKLLYALQAIKDQKDAA